MPLLPKLIERLQRHPKRIVFPEGAAPRILQAARQWVTRRLGAPILLGDRSRIKEAAARLDVNLAGMRVIEPSRSEDFDRFVGEFETLRRDKGLKPGDARAAMLDCNYFATMMLATSQVDALVGGATVSASSALRPLFLTVRDGGDRALDGVRRGNERVLRARLADLGGHQQLGGTPEDFGKVIALETEKWAKVVKFSGAKVE